MQNTTATRGKHERRFAEVVEVRVGSAVRIDCPDSVVDTIRGECYSTRFFSLERGAVDEERMDLAGRKMGRPFAICSGEPRLRRTLERRIKVYSREATNSTNH